MTAPRHQIRALFTDSAVTVYQAYAPEIGLPAARKGRFPATWRRHRMTWIKPSFLWMMYRCGWGTKEGQEVSFRPVGERLPAVGALEKRVSGVLSALDGSGRGL